MGEHGPVKCISLSSERENSVLQWTLQLNNVLATAENQHFYGHTPNVKPVTVWSTYWFPPQRSVWLSVNFTQSSLAILM